MDYLLLPLFIDRSKRTVPNRMGAKAGDNSPHMETQRGMDDDEWGIARLSSPGRGEAGLRLNAAPPIDGQKSPLSALWNHLMVDRCVGRVCSN